MGTDIEVLIVGNAYLEKDRQPKELQQRYEDRFELD
jgi:carbamoyltransferase